MDPRRYPPSNHGYGSQDYERGPSDYDGYRSRPSGQRDYPDRQDYPGRSGYPDRQDYPGRADYPGRGDNTARGDNTGRGRYPGRQDHPGRGDYPRRPDYPGLGDYERRPDSPRPAGRQDRQGSPRSAPQGKPPQRRDSHLAAWTAGISVLALAAAGVLFMTRGSHGGQHPTSSAAVGAASASARAQAPGPARTASSSPAGSSAPPASLGSGWKKTFNATFTGSGLDSSVWDTCYPWESQSGCANFGNSAEEYQWYTPSQDQVSGGALNIVAQKEPTEGTTSDGSPEAYPYRSGLVTTFPGYSFQYGYIQVTASMPSAKGLWTALWLAAKNEQWPPEIDIVEHWDDDAKFFQYYHPAGAPRENSSVTLPGSPAAWHTYGVYWTASGVTWYIDGRPVFQTGRNVPQQPMYFLANIAVDEHVDSLGSSAKLGIKSVSVWQRP